MAEALYFEDVVVGASVDTPARTLTETDFLQYVSVAGDSATRVADVSDRVMPDLLPLCASSGLTWRIPQRPLSILAFMGFEWQFFKPVRIGDTVRCRLRSLAKRKTKEGGVVIQEHTMINQRDEVVQRGKVTLLVGSRPTV